MDESGIGFVRGRNWADPMACRWLCWLAAGLITCGPGQGAAYVFQLPDGLEIERVAGPPDIRFPMFGALDEQGRLFVTESSGGDLYQELKDQQRGCRISRLEDADGDGRYERAEVFAEGLVPSMGLVWRQNKLYVADPPDLITLEDTDGDGMADKRSVLLTGFGHTDNGSLHGLIFGPDGWLYMTMGWPDSFQLHSRDGTWLSGKTGALIRCRPDGTRPEALARGFDQLVELAFTAGGEILGSQTWYQNPSGGIRDSLTHLLPGGHYPQRWQDEQPLPFITHPEPLPPLILLPAVAHSGITLARSAAFGPEWQGRLFSAEFNTRKVVAYSLKPHGATYMVEPADFITTDDPDFRPADVLEDLDGTMLVIDTGSWYVQHCPTGRMRQSTAPGAIYRVRKKGGARPADPAGSQLHWADVSVATLAGRLRDARPAVRDRALEALVQLQSGAIDALRQVASAADAKDESCAAAVWALARIGQEPALRTLQDLLESSNPTVLRAASRALGLHREPSAAARLENLLRHSDPQVCLAAAEALATCGRPRSTAPLLHALEGSPDRPMEHATIYALHRTAAEREVRDALTHAHPAVQRAALLILAQPPHQSLTITDVLKRLSSTDQPLRSAALFCLRLRPDWAPHAIKYVITRLRSQDLSPDNEAALFSLARSPFAPGMDSALARLLVEPDHQVPVSRKLSVLDLIQRGSYQEAAELRDPLAAAVTHPSAPVRAKAVQAMAAARGPTWRSLLERIAADPKEEAVVRIEALAAVVRHQTRLTPDLERLLSSRLLASTDPLARIRAAEILSATRPSPWVLHDLLRAAEAEPTLSPNHLLAAAQRTDLSPELFKLLLQYLSRSVERGWAVPPNQLESLLKRAPQELLDQVQDLSRAVRSQAEQQQALLKDYEPLLAGGDSSRGRQLFFGKVACAACHRVGQEGLEVGPDLTKLGAIRSGRDILESVLLPSSTFAQGFETYLAELKDGESVTGTLSRELPEAVILRTASGAEMRLPREDVKSLTKSRLSMMPEGLLQVLSRNEAADLLAFLQDLK